MTVHEAVPPPADQSWLQVTVPQAGRRLRAAGTWLVSTARRRLPGVSQTAGVAAVVAGVFVLAGLGVGLVVGGVLAVALGFLFEPAKES